MITIYLIIAHLLADFTLQPSKLIHFKSKSAKGVLIHVMIFAILALAMLSTCLIHWETWAVIGGISIVHFFTDQAKINLELKHDRSYFHFIADQAVHYNSLLIGGYILDKLDIGIVCLNFGNPAYHDLTIWILLLIGIFIIYAINIIFVQPAELNSYGHKHKKKIENPTEIIIKKLLIFSLVYSVYVGTVIVLFR
ncbi:DUF3307 domain-containing protein [Patescibacteria group bacterium]|nr:DUF3307 domain-containing protein [Patescibacteria group bacterium]